MKKVFLNLIYMMFFAGAISLSSCETKAKEDLVLQQDQNSVDQDGQDRNGEQADVFEYDMASILEEWPDKPREVANSMIEKYGQPDEVTDSRMIWYETGDWKRTIVYKEEVDHNFPMPHVDVLEQTIDYQLDTEKYNDVVEYDGSVFAERTKGELSARCDEEALNYLAINLAYEVEQGTKTVEEAREFYTEQAIAYKMGESSEYLEGFIFDLPGDDATDPDEVAVEEGMEAL
jgi:hypothetical protein